MLLDLKFHFGSFFNSETEPTHTHTITWMNSSKANREKERQREITRKKPNSYTPRSYTWNRMLILIINNLHNETLSNRNKLFFILFSSYFFPPLILVIFVQK